MSGSTVILPCALWSNFLTMQIVLILLVWMPFLNVGLWFSGPQRKLWMPCKTNSLELVFSSICKYKIGKEANLNTKARKRDLIFHGIHSLLCWLKSQCACAATNPQCCCI